MSFLNDTRINLRTLNTMANLFIVALLVPFFLMILNDFVLSSKRPLVNKLHTDNHITEQDVENYFHNLNLNLKYKYHNYNELSKLLKLYASTYPNKCHLYSIGRSVEGRELWVMAIADSEPGKHRLLRPEIKYVGNQHGNEAPSRELLLYFIDYLLTSQQSDPYVDYLLKNSRIHILVSLNPDAYEKSIEGSCDELPGNPNANGVNLNRNFPDFFECNRSPVQQETSAIMNWLNSEQFILSGNFHTGALLINYPFDNYKRAVDSDANSTTAAATTIESPTDDDDVFRYMSTIYSFAHTNMSYYRCATDPNFTDGITNGGLFVLFIA